MQSRRGLSSVGASGQNYGKLYLPRHAELQKDFICISLESSDRVMRLLLLLVLNRQKRHTTPQYVTFGTRRRTKALIGNFSMTI